MKARKLSGEDYKRAILQRYAETDEDHIIHVPENAHEHVDMGEDRHGERGAWVPVELWVPDWEAYQARRIQARELREERNR